VAAPISGKPQLTLVAQARATAATKKISKARKERVKSAAKNSATMKRRNPMNNLLPKSQRDKGWEYYGRAPFKENLSKIQGILGTVLYQTLQYDGHVWIRRAV
jgi:hypothetical protein